jgi:hypothetical protein
MDREDQPTAALVRRFVDAYRDSCLWFLRADYYPEGLEETLNVLGYVERYGDRDGYRQTAERRRWLLQRSKGRSAAS